ncbi:MAG TPA: hypothetical protein VM186_12150 [Planctomycetota bacterium]|nr:hypothetical protein [Planctomycetota bacterium]
MRNRFTILFAAGILIWAGGARAVELRPVSVLGNSGYAGDSLFKMLPGGYPGGVALDDDLTLWHTAAPDRLERVSLDGRVLTAYRIEGARMGDLGHNIRLAVIGDYIVSTNVHSGQFMAMRRDADPANDAMKPLKLDPPIQFWYATGLGSHGIDGRAIIDSRTAVHAVDPATGKTEKLFDTPQPLTEHGVEVAADGTIYATSGRKTWALNKTGKILREGPGMWGRLCAVPGGVFGFNWNSAQYNTVSIAEPRNLFWNPGIELGRLGQVAPTAAVAAISAAGPHGTFAFASQAGPIYLGELAGDHITFTRRYGSIALTAIGLTPDDEVFASWYGGVEAWHWDDPADAVPFHAQSFHETLAVRQVASHGRWTFGIKQSYRATEPMQVWAWPPTRYGILYSKLEGERPARPLGLAVTSDKRLVISAENDRELYFTEARENGQANSNVRKLPWAGQNTLKAPGDLAAWTQGRIAVADGNAIVMIEPAGDACKESWRLSSWGGKPDEHFGDELHIAITGDYLLVSDTQRHRVLLFNLPDRKLLAQTGQTDAPGTSVGAFDQPAQLAANGLRVAVFDRGNQRIVKCDIKP